MSEFFDGHVITVSEGTMRPHDLIEAVVEALEDIRGEYGRYDETRRSVYGASDLEELEAIYEELEEELEEVANRSGYTFGTLEGDGAHFVLAPLTQDRLYG